MPENKEYYPTTYAHVHRCDRCIKATRATRTSKTAARTSTIDPAFRAGRRPKRNVRDTLRSTKIATRPTVATELLQAMSGREASGWELLRRPHRQEQQSSVLQRRKYVSPVQFHAEQILLRMSLTKIRFSDCLRST